MAALVACAYMAIGVARQEFAMKTLQVEKLTAEAFSEFGDVICTAGNQSHQINQGNTERFPELTLVDAETQGGQAAIHIFRSQPIGLPLVIKEMEKHPLSSQAFMPLHNRPFLVIVAPAGERVNSDSIRAFMTDGTQGINLRRGTWHHFQVSLEQESDYLVIDRVGPGRNLEEQLLDPALIIQSLT
jgi:ureidoglycolate lyase